MGDGRLQRLFHFRPVESKDDDIDRLAGLANGLHDRLHAVVGLNDQLHLALAFFSDHSTEPCPFGSSARMALLIGSRSVSSGTDTS